MRTLSIALVLGTMLSAGAAIQSDYTHAARMAQIQQTPSAELHRTTAARMAEAERAEEQPALPPGSGPVRWSFGARRASIV